MNRRDGYQLRNAARSRAEHDRRLRNGWLVALLVDVGLIAGMVVTGAEPAAYVATVVFFIVTLALVVGKTFAARNHDAEADLYDRIARS